MFQRFSTFLTRSGVNFTNIFMLSFYACRSRKRKKTDELTVFFTLLGSASIKAVRRTLMKSTPGVTLKNSSYCDAKTITSFIETLWPLCPHYSVKQTCHSWLPFGLFWNGLPETTFFGLFSMLKKIVYFKACFEQNLQYVFMKFSLWVLLFQQTFEENFGLFSSLRIWPFLKLLMAKFGLFNFFGPSNPAVTLRTA